jgi:hypothetical protein
MGDLSKKPKKGAAKVRHLGRRKTQIARYYANTYPRHKIRRILKNNGFSAAQSWAMSRGFIGIFFELTGR